jgi:hypothetical protein
MENLLETKVFWKWGSGYGSVVGEPTTIKEVLTLDADRMVSVGFEGGLWTEIVPNYDEDAKDFPWRVGEEKFYNFQQAANHVFAEHMARKEYKRVQNALFDIR